MKTNYSSSKLFFSALFFTGNNLSIHLGDHQFALPINLIVAGTTKALTIVASRRLANAKPNPICLRITTEDKQMH